MFFARLLFPGSKLSLKTLGADSVLASSCGLTQEYLDEDRLHKVMDALSGKWAGSERSLCPEALPKGVSLVLYDLASSYFESAKDKRLASHGYSRDHRSDRPQVILALDMDTDGVPIHIEVLKWDRADNKTLLPLLASLRRASASPRRFSHSMAV